jgi:hypothetical protein
VAKRVNIPTRTNLRERRKRRQQLVVGLVVLSVVFVIATLIGVTWLPFLQIRAVDVSGVTTVPQDQVERFAASELVGTYGYVIPRRNIFFYPKLTIQSTLLQEFPSFATVNVHTVNFHALSVAVTERQPAALWCGPSSAATTASASSTQSGPCFLMDSNGTIYAPAVVYSGDAYRRYFGGANDGALPRQFLTTQQSRSLSALADSLSQQHPVQTVTVDENNDVYITFTNGFMLIFALSDGSADVLERFSLALQADPFTTHPLEDFAYLDLRFGKKLFYSLKNSKS